MKELNELITRYGERYSHAVIYIIFVIVSLLVSVILFGILHSTGVMKLVFASAIEQAEFGGAFAGFLVTLILLIKSYNQALKEAKLIITGNVLNVGNNPVKGALVFVEGVDRQKETDTTGWFAIEVNEQDSWVVRASYEEKAAQETVTRGNIRKPVRLVLRGSGVLTKQVSPQRDIVSGDLFLHASASEKFTNKLSTESIEQAAAVCYRQNNGQIDFLLILTSGRRWMFPKGGPESGEPLWRTAEREAHEEAGASGKISHQILTTFRHLKRDLKQHGRELIVAAFLLEVDRTYKPNEEHRNPTWFTQEEAVRALSEGRDFIYAEELKRVVMEASSIITQEIVPKRIANIKEANQ